MSRDVLCRVYTAGNIIYYSIFNISLITGLEELFGEDGVLEVLCGVVATFCAHGVTLLGGQIGELEDGLGNLCGVFGFDLQSAADALDETVGFIDGEDDGFGGEHVVGYLVEGGAVLVKEAVDAAGIADVELGEEEGYGVFGDGGKEGDVGEVEVLGELDELGFLRTVANEDEGEVGTTLECFGGLDENVHGGGLGVAASKADEGLVLLAEGVDGVEVLLWKGEGVELFPFLG